MREKCNFMAVYFWSRKLFHEIKETWNSDSAWYLSKDVKQKTII